MPMRMKKINKGYLGWKERGKSTLISRGHDLFHIENLEESTKQLQELISEFRKAAEYKVRTVMLH